MQFFLLQNFHIRPFALKVSKCELARVSLGNVSCLNTGSTVNISVGSSTIGPSAYYNVNSTHTPMDNTLLSTPLSISQWG